MRTTPSLIAALLVALATAACATSYAARRPPENGFLSDYARLHKGGPHQAELVWVAEDVDWASYDKILLDPVTIWRSARGHGGLSQQQAQTLANYFAQMIYNDLSKYWTLVDTPGPGTLRVAVALTKLDEERVVLDVVSSIEPHVRALNTLQSILTDRLAFTGAAAIEARISDAESGEILAEGVDERIGRQAFTAEQLHTWGDVQAIMEFWTRRSVHNLCTAQERKDCPPLPTGA